MGVRLEIEDHKSRDELFLQKLRQIVYDNLDNEQFGVDNLAKSYGISRSQLHRKLQKLTKKSISRYIREIRLDEAHKMLRRDTGTISEIAYRVGFNSPTYFNTSFRNYFGYPPGEVQMRASMSQTGSRNAMDLPMPRKKVLEPKNTFAIVGVMLAILLVLSVVIFSDNSDKRAFSDTNSNKLTDNTGINIAILPLKNWSGDPELDYVSYGITDAVITRISVLNSIERIIPFNTILGYANSELDLNEIAEELQLDYVVEGNYQVSGHIVKVKIQLFNPKLNKQTNLSEYYGEWKENELFLLQSNIAEGVVELLELELSSNEMQSLSQIPTENEEAYLAYLKGYYQLLKSNEEGLRNARIFFEEAIQLDPGFIDPYIYLIEAWSTSGLFWGVNDQQEAWSNSKKLITAAMRQQPNKDETLRLNGKLCNGEFYYEWKFDCVQSYLSKYDQGESDLLDLPIHLDHIRKLGRHADALKHIEGSMKSVPNLGIFYASKAFSLFFQNQPEEAEAFLESSNKLFNDHFFYISEAAKLYYYLGNYRKFENQLGSLLNKFPDHPPLITWFRLINSDLQNNTEEIERFRNMLLADFENKASGSPAWFLALYYCHIKDYDSAFNWLQKSYEDHEVEMTWLKEEPLLRPLRTDPRYIELYKKVGFPFPIEPYKEVVP